MKKIIYFLIILASLSGQSCIVPSSIAKKRTHKPYHIPSSFEHGSTNNVYNLRTCGKAKRQNKVSLGVIEFDDQGEMWSSSERFRTNPPKTQLDHVLDALNKQVTQGPVRLVVFVHGWNNSARTSGFGSGNYLKFKEALQELPCDQEERIFGVFIGWRGGVTKLPILMDVTTREAAADRVAGAPLLSALEALSACARKDSRSRVQAIGHSFGAKILAHVTANSLAARIGANRGSGSTSPIKPLADTVVLVNTAESGRIPHQLIRLFKDYDVKSVNTFTKRSTPLIVCIAAESDFLVKYGIPVIDLVTRFVLGYPSRGGASSGQSQYLARAVAMGYASGIVSHKLQRSSVSSPMAVAGGFKDSGALLSLNTEIGSSRPSAEGVVLQARLYENSAKDNLTTNIYDVVPHFGRTDYYRKTPRNSSPFWVIQVPNNVVKGHNALWNANFFGLVTAIDAMSRSPKNPTRAVKPTRYKVSKE